MASACVNNIGIPPDKFSPAKYGWLSPRVSFGCDATEIARVSISSPANNKNEVTDPDVSGGEFEFCLEDPVAMLPADELFSGGKLMPLHINSSSSSTVKSAVNDEVSSEARLPEPVKFRLRTEEIMSSATLSDPYLFSPKAPRCSSRWRELLGLKKLHLNSTNGSVNGVKSEAASKTTTNTTSSDATAPKSRKSFLHRSSKSLPSSADLSLPLLRDSDCESVSISSRLSLSSSSSGQEHDDLPRLSLDSDKPHQNPNPNHMFSVHRKPSTRGKTAVKIHEIKQRAAAEQAAARGVNRGPMRRSTPPEPASRGGVSIDSPRMNSSGKIVFQSLERSSSSPSSFNGGARLKHRGMERSYSANVRVTPVLNVPVCSLRGGSKSGFGFGQLFSFPQKRGDLNGVVSGKNGGQHSNYVQQSQSHCNKNRVDRN